MLKKLSLKEFINNSIDISNNNLPALPKFDELLLIRKAMRKKSLPDVLQLPVEWDYKEIGRFKKYASDSTLIFEWNTKDGKCKRCSFIDLCMSPSHELDRLELGWMIADFARFDGINYLSQMRPHSYEESQLNYFNKQYAIQKKHYQKIEGDWRHWAVVPAGHMLMSE